MKLILTRKAGSCCSTNYYFELNEPLNLNKFATLNPDPFFKSRGHLMIVTTDYNIRGTSGDNKITITIRVKDPNNTIIAAIISKLEAL